MAKVIDTYVKLQVPAGQASPSPPVGPALGQHGLPLMDFCNAFNAITKEFHFFSSSIECITEVHKR